MKEKIKDYIKQLKKAAAEYHDYMNECYLEKMRENESYWSGRKHSVENTINDLERMLENEKQTKNLYLVTFNGDVFNYDHTKYFYDRKLYIVAAENDITIQLKNTLKTFNVTLSKITKIELIKGLENE